MIGPEFLRRPRCLGARRSHPLVLLPSCQFVAFAVPPSSTTQQPTPNPDAFEITRVSDYLHLLWCSSDRAATCNPAHNRAGGGGGHLRASIATSQRAADCLPATSSADPPYPTILECTSVSCTHASCQWYTAPASAAGAALGSMGSDALCITCASQGITHATYHM